MTRILTASLTLVFLMHSVMPLLAFETDQYNLPPQQLADIGDEVTEYVAKQVLLATAKLNSQIAASEACLSLRSKGCDSPEKERRDLAYLRSEQAIAKAVYELLSGGNLMTTKFGKWMQGHKFRSQPASYKAPYLESIYVIKPSNYATLSPTIRMYGHEFGIDKLEHLFQQGHQYFEKVNDSIKAGRPREAAVKVAIEWGKRTERTYYGILTSGVYSNADLFANYAGLRFYEGLTRSTEIGGSTRPAMLKLREGRWHPAGEEILAAHLLKPFISDHMNEAFNPSAFRVTLIRSVRRSVRKYSCEEWTTGFPTMTSAILQKRFSSLEKWHGEDYGHTKRRGFVNIGEICFGADDPGRSG